jgi:hypothetical protein
MDYSWEIDVLKNIIGNMENGTTDFDFLIERLVEVLDSVEEKSNEEEE